MRQPGSMRKRSGDAWELTVRLGAEYKGQKRFTKTVHGTEKEAAAALSVFYADCIRGLKDQAGKDTIAELVESYITERPKGSLKSSTIDGYKKHMRCYIVPYIGKLKVSRVSARRLQAWVDALSRDKSPKTVRAAVSLLSAAYDRAVIYDEVTSNPCKKLILPRKEKKEAEYYNRDEAAEFIKALEDEEIVYRVAFKLAIYCGLRRGEILGLNVEDVDLNKCLLDIKRTRYAYNGGRIEDTPKTEASRRVISFPPALAEDLNELYRYYDSRAEIMGKDWKRSPALIRSVWGEPLYPTLLLKHLHKLQDSHGLKRITLHQLRHTNVSIMIGLGADIKAIQARGGYSNASTPLNIYGHIFDNRDKELAEEIERAVNGAVDK